MLEISLYRKDYVLYITDSRDKLTKLAGIRQSNLPMGHGFELSGGGGEVERNGGNSSCSTTAREFP